jgi:ADP-heptose:LPS heptosyltransferase
VKTVYRRRECLGLLDTAFNWTSSPDVPVLTLPSQVKPVVDALLSSWGVTDRDFLVGIHTSSRQDREIRCWEEGKFATVANLLIERHNAKVVFTDIAADRPYVEPVIAGIGRKDRIVDAMGRTTLPELYALLKRIDLFICINTAPMHLAVDAGTPLVAILGYAPGRIYFPPGDDRIQWVEDPALKSYDPALIVQTEPSRIREIPVDAVMEKVEYLIEHVIKNRKNP